MSVPLAGILPAPMAINIQKKSITPKRFSANPNLNLLTSPKHHPNITPNITAQSVCLQIISLKSDVSDVFLPKNYVFFFIRGLSSASPLSISFTHHIAILAKAKAYDERIFYMKYADTYKPTVEDLEKAITQLFA